MKSKGRCVFDENWGTEEEKAKALEFLSDSRFQRLTNYQKTVLLRVFKKLSGPELDFLNRIWGKTPSQVVHIMAQEFADRCGVGHLHWYVHHIIKMLSPSHSWPQLDLNISRFVGSTYIHVFMKRDDCLKSRDDVIYFWGRMRFLLRPLPKRNRVKKSASPAENIENSLKLRKPKFHWTYLVCELCWRTVPVNLGNIRGGGVLCFEHDRNSNDPVFRKHKRLKPQVSSIAYDLETRLLEEYPDSVSEARDRELYRHLNRIHLLNAQSPLKNLVEYILNQIKGYAWNATKKDIWEIVLETFHGPFPQGLEPLYREAMDAYIHDRVFFETLVDILQLALAEAWLTALKTDRRRKQPA